jgi:hypothetical protein
MSISSVRKNRAAVTPSGNGYYAEYENKVSRRIVNPPQPHRYAWQNFAELESGRSATI